MLEVFKMLVSRGFCVSINVCNSFFGGLVKVGWVDLVREVYEEVVNNGV